MAGTTVIYLPAKCEDVGLNREQGALIISIQGAVIIFSQIVIGLLVDLLHIPKSYLLMSSLLGMSVATVAITFCQTFSLFALCISLFAFCLGKYFKVKHVSKCLKNSFYALYCLLWTNFRINYNFLSVGLDFNLFWFFHIRKFKMFLLEHVCSFSNLSQPSTLCLESHKILMSLFISLCIYRSDDMCQGEVLENMAVSTAGVCDHLPVTCYIGIKLQK